LIEVIKLLRFRIYFE